MAELSVQTMTIDGIVPSYGAAASGGDTFANDGKTFLHVKNGGGSSINVTLSSQVTNPPAGTAATNKVIAVAAGAEKMIGPLPANGWNDANGQVHVNYSAVTSVTLAAVKLGS